MNNNFSLNQNLQISKENVYVHLSVDDNLEEDIETLSKNYEIHRSSQVKDFLRQNSELLPYINAITPLIDNYFPDYKKCITFCQDPEFDKLDDITIYINSFKSEFDNDWRKLDELEKELFHISDFSTNIKGLISVDLWLA